MRKRTAATIPARLKARAMLFWTMVTMPVLAYRGLHFGSRYRPLSMRIQEQLATLTARVEQNLRGARVVKAFAQEDAEIERVDPLNEEPPVVNATRRIGTWIRLWWWKPIRAPVFPAIPACTAMRAMRSLRIRSQALAGQLRTA